MRLQRYKNTPKAAIALSPQTYILLLKQKKRPREPNLEDAFAFNCTHYTPIFFICQPFFEIFTKKLSDIW